LHKPWLLLPPQWAHNLSPLALNIYSTIYGQNIPEWKSFDWNGLHFKNPIGIAGGVDKNATHLDSWWALGCGFIEVGTITPLPQLPNPGKIVDRSLSLKAMWNKMGFPSDGAEEVHYNLMAHFPNFQTPVFINIGKNRKTPNEIAVEDYLSLIEQFHLLADAFVVNISSPNTQGLRELQKKENLDSLLTPLLEKSSKLSQRPLLVKLSPDMGDEGFAEALVHCSNIGVNGFVLTNTTLARPKNCHFPTEGGLSGAPLSELSTHVLKIAIERLGTKRKDFLIVSVGGISTPEEAFERLHLGADLVQIYSALVFHGPKFFLDVASRFNGR